MRQGRHDLGAHLHEKLERHGQLNATRTHGVSSVNPFIGLHLFNNGFGFSVCCGQQIQVRGQMGLDLFFSLHHKPQAHSVFAGFANGQSQRKRAGVPKGIEVTRVTAQFFEPIVGPHQMIALFNASAFELGRKFGVVGGQGL